MSLKIQLPEDMKNAMRARDMERLGVIRFLLAELKNYEIDNGEQDDAGIQSLVSRQIKQIKEAITEYEKAGRSDLVESEQNKVSVLQTYLPAQLSEAELKSLVQAAIDQAEAKQIGPVMQILKPQVTGRADGSQVATLVREMLG